MVAPRCKAPRSSWGDPNVEESSVGTVLVIGAGGAGLSAALEAARAGADVTVLDAAEKVGGATARAGGVVYAAGTRVQEAAGVEDDVDELFSYYMTITHHLLEPRLMRVSAEGTRDAIEWLEELGITWDPSRLYVAGLETRPRGHMPSGDTMGLGPAGGAIIVATLLRAATEAGVSIRTATRVADLLHDERGAVVGVRTSDGEELAADAVVLATGGFGAGQEMLERYYPDATVHGDWHWYLGPPENVGDGLRMGVDAGGVVIHENSGVLMVTPNFGRLNDAFTPPWLIFVNVDGQRFINEMDTYCVLGAVIRKQPGSRCFAIFDEAALGLAEAEAVDVDPYGLGIDLESNWTGEMLRAQIANGRVLSGPTIEGLAAIAGIDALGLSATVESWNADVAAGADSTFEKPVPILQPVSTPPFYAVELRSAIIGMTFPGLRIDDKARVLDAAGRPISGLYAAGEIAGGLDGEVYSGGGTSIGNALVFGRIAGQGAAMFSQSPTSS